MEKVLSIASNNTKGAVAIHNEYKAFSIALQDCWGFRSGIYFSDEDVEKLKNLCEEYLQKVKEQNK